MKKEHILVIRFSAMGDVAMTVPVISALAKQYPNLRITVLSKPFARSFYENLAPNVSFMEADIKGEYHGVKCLNALYRRLTAKHFTMVADLHDTLRSKYLRLRFNLNKNHVEHINKHRKARQALTRQHNKKLQPIPTAFDNYAEVFRKLGYPIFLTIQPSAPITHHSTSRAIGIAPFAAHKGKIYPFEQMEKVIQELCNRLPDCMIYLFGGGKSEMNIINEWVAKYPSCINASGNATSLQDEIEIMSRLNVMISMDSANMHLASLAGIPVVSIWGATHPYAGFMGWGQSMDNAVQEYLTCRPCSIYGKKPCIRGDYACLTQISPQSIIEKTLHIINI